MTYDPNVYRYWEEPEIQYLIEHYHDTPTRKIAKALGRSVGSTQKKVRDLGLPQKVKRKQIEPITKCWSCRNAVPSIYKEQGCSWSRDFIPVKGWTAKKTIINIHGSIRRENESYFVRSCPEYISDREVTK